jgi:hypothetical protein
LMPGMVSRRLRWASSGCKRFQSSGLRWSICSWKRITVREVFLQQQTVMRGDPSLQRLLQHGAFGPHARTGILGPDRWVLVARHQGR